jgi:hypothetical protein
MQQFGFVRRGYPGGTLVVSRSWNHAFAEALFE